MRAGRLLGVGCLLMVLSALRVGWGDGAATQGAAGVGRGWMGPNAYGRVVFREGAEKREGEVAAIEARGGSGTVIDAGNVEGMDFSKGGMTDEELRKFVMVAGLSGMRLRHVRLNGTKVTDEGVKELVKLNGVEGVDLTGTLVTDAGVRELVKIGGLKYLALGKTGVTDEGMRALFEGAKELRGLDVNHTAVGDAGWAWIARMEKLEGVDLFATRGTDGGLKVFDGNGVIRRFDVGSVRGPNKEAITDAGMKWIGGIVHLQQVDLDAQRVTDDGVGELARCGELENFFAPSTKITGSGMGKLAGLAKLQTVILAGCPVTDDSVAGICELKQVRSLNLDRTKITDVGLKKVGEGMVGLKTLSVVRTGVTAEEIKEMKIQVKWSAPGAPAAGTQKTPQN